jgi:hypothetical protein
MASEGAEFPGRLGPERPGREADERLIWEALGGQRARNVHVRDQGGAFPELSGAVKEAVERCLLDDLEADVFWSHPMGFKF